MASLDAYRGFVMLALVANGLGSVQMARSFPGSWWSAVGRQFRHTPWIGCTFYDLIMPAFLLMIGMAVPFSYARRATQGDSQGKQFRHAAVRAIVLVLLGMLLQPQHALLTNVLTQVGFGYLLVFWLQTRTFGIQLASIVGILTGYWLMFVLYPVPASDFNSSAGGMAPGELLPGIWAHWSKNVNIGADIDGWLLNIFPQDTPFRFHTGGVVVITFIPAMANMLLGVMAGQMLMRASTPKRKLAWLIGSGAVCMAVALAAGFTICPIVKRLWTSSFALYSGAWALWMFAVFYWVVEMVGWRRWTFPLVVFGANSIAIYLMSELWPAWIVGMVKVHFGKDMFTGIYGPVWSHCIVLFVLWLICWLLYRRKLFLKI